MVLKDWLPLIGVVVGALLSVGPLWLGRRWERQRERERWECEQRLDAYADFMARVEEHTFRHPALLKPVQDEQQLEELVRLSLAASAAYERVRLLA